MQLLEQFRRFDDGRSMQPGILAGAHPVRHGMPGTYPTALWLNPEPAQLRPCRQSIAIIRERMETRASPITIKRLERAMRYLSK